MAVDSGLLTVLVLLVLSTAHTTDPKLQTQTHHRCKGKSSVFV